jgi:hypothetical protein
MGKFPVDRFDHYPDNLERVGAHRAATRRGKGWVAFAWAALTTVILVSVGIVGLFIINDTVSFDFIPTVTSSPPTTAEPTVGPTVAPTIDPTVEIHVLNGTATAGLAARVAEQLTGAGWTQNITVANADREDVPETVVYYEDASQEGIARGIVQSLGVGRSELSNVFAATGDETVPGETTEMPMKPITVVVGSDYIQSPKV